MSREFQAIDKRPDFSQSGQALVEYILLVVVSISLILALANQLYKPFNKWLENYMGAYLQCLLDAGELPSLGYTAEEAICNTDKFEPATVLGGRPPSDGRGPTGGEGNPDNSPNRPSSSAGSGSSNGSGGSSSSRQLGFQTGTGGADGAAAGTSEAEGEGASEGRSSTRFFRAGATGYNQIGANKTFQYEAITGAMAAERAKQVKKSEQSRTVASASDLSSEKRGAKFRVEPPPPKAQEVTSDPPWSIGKWLRMVIIVMIIVAAILFLVGQFSQLSKSMEK